MQYIFSLCIVSQFLEFLFLRFFSSIIYVIEPCRSVFTKTELITLLLLQSPKIVTLILYKLFLVKNYYINNFQNRQLPT